MGRKNRADLGHDDESPRRGKRRSIRLDAVPFEPDGRPRQRAADAPPAIQLRRLPAESAIEKLEIQLAVHRDKGMLTVLVVHGRGKNSPGGQPVIAPLVREWLDKHPAVVASWREAPREWGGEGAVVVELRRRS